MNNNQTMKITAKLDVLTRNELCDAIDELCQQRQCYAENIGQLLINNDERAQRYILTTSFLTDIINHLESVKNTKTLITSRVENMGGGCMVQFIDINQGGKEWLLTYYDDNALYLYENVTSDDYINVDDPGMYSYTAYYDFHELIAVNDYIMADAFDVDKLKWLLDDEDCQKVVKILSDYEQKY